MSYTRNPKTQAALGEEEIRDCLPLVMSIMDEHFKSNDKSMLAQEIVDMTLERMVVQ